MKKIILLISLFIAVSIRAQIELLTPYSNSWQSICVAHNARVVADGGTIPNYTGLFNANLENPNSIKAFYDPDIIGYKAVGDSVGTLYSLKSNSDIVFVAGKRPRLLTWNSSEGNYLYCPETSGAQVFAFDAANNRITGSIDIDVKFKLVNYGDLIGKCVLTTNVSWGIRILSGSLQFMYSPDGTSGNWVLKSVSITNSDFLNTVKHIRVTRDLTSGDVKFYFKSGSNWVQIGTTQTSTAGQVMFAGTSPVYLSNHVSDPFKGNIYEAHVYNGFRESGGTLVLSFDCSNMRPENNAYLVSTATKEQWLIPAYWSGAANSIKHCFVNRTMIQFDGLTHIGKTQFTIGSFTCILANIKTARYAANNVLLDGYTAGTAKLKMSTTINRYDFNGGSDLGSILVMPGNTDIIGIVKNGNSSKLQFAYNSPLTGNSGATDVDGITIGGDGATYGNIILKSLLVRNSTSISNSDISKLKIIGKNNYTKSAYVLGNSIGQGTGTAYLYSKWSSLVCDSKGFKEINLCVGGTTAQKRTPQDYIAAPNFVDAAANMPICTDTTNTYVLVEFGTNDIGSESYPDYTSQHFSDDYTTALTSLVNKGYKRVYCLGIGYLKNKTAEQIEVYNTIINSISATKSYHYVATRQAMVDAGGDAIMMDNAHPNITGHLVIATQVINAIQ